MRDRTKTEACKRKDPPPRHEDRYTNEQQEADVLLAKQYKQDTGFVQKPIIRRQLLRRATQGPNAKWRGEANYYLGALYEEGAKGSIKRDPFLAREFYQKATLDGHHPASIRMLRMEHFPEVYIKLRPDEFTLSERREKFPGSLTHGAKLFAQEKYPEALQILTHHAKHEVSEAQYLLYFMYLLGYGIEADELRARAWCYLAAKGGLLAAQSALGCDLVFDRIVPSDEAELWLRRAAKRNDSEAIGHLGILLMSSRDPRRKPDVKLGLSYLEKAASLGSSFAMLRLGEIYLGKVFTGSVTIDRECAKAWYMAAADTGDEAARKLLRKDFKIKYAVPGVICVGKKASQNRARRD